MTEEKWLNTSHPYDLTHYKACRSERKRRLLSCAFARRVLFLIPDECYRLAIETAERYADGLVTEQELGEIRRSTSRAWKKRHFMEAGNHAATAALSTLHKKSVEAVHGLESAAAAQASLSRPNWDKAHKNEILTQCAMARDVFGNPFRPVTIARSWLTAKVQSLALAAYAERCLPTGELELDRLAVLSDALEEVGCDNTDILSHCRGFGPHVRGCWVVDLILGKG